MTSNFMVNRSWMYNRRRPGGGVTPEFRDGVEFFLQYAYSHPREIVDGEIVCPCVACRFRYFKGREIVVEHLYKNGFDRNYYVWIYHGESNDLIHNSGQPGQAGTSGQAGFNDMFVDLGEGHVHIDVDSPEDEHVDNNFQSEQPNVEAKAFYDMLDHLDEELYEGSNKISPIVVVAELLQIKADTGVSIEACNAFLGWAKKLLSHNNKLPSTFREAEAMFNKLGRGMERIDACPNDCMLYYKETSNLDVL